MEEGKEEDEEPDFWAVKVISSGYFTLISLILIIGNTVVLACENYNNTPSRVLALENYNKYFTYVFTVEMLFKIYALGLKGYVRDGFKWWRFSI